jgi:hypothetical protein
MSVTVTEIPVQHLRWKLTTNTHRHVPLRIPHVALAADRYQTEDGFEVPPDAGVEITGDAPEY